MDEKLTGGRIYGCGVVIGDDFQGVWKVEIVDFVGDCSVGEELCRVAKWVLVFCL